MLISPGPRPMSTLLTCFLVLPLLAFTSAQDVLSQEISRLRIPSEIQVDGEVVTLLHLFEHEGLSQGLKELMGREVIGSISEEGGRKYVYGEQLKDFVREFFTSHGVEVNRLELDFPAQIVVERQSPLVSGGEIVQLLKEHVSKVLGSSQGGFTIKDAQFPATLSLPPGRKTARVVADPGQAHCGPVKFTVEFYVDGRKAASTSVSATVHCVQRVVHTLHPIKKNQLITPGDIDVRPLEGGDGEQGFFEEAGDVVGKQALRDLDGLQPIRKNDAADALVVKRGDSVTIVYETPGLKVTAGGQARQNGIKGQVIKVVNTKSNRSLDCRVIDSETVEAVR